MCISPLFAGNQGVVNVWDVNTAALDTPDTMQQQSLMGLEDSQTSSIAAAEARWSRLIGEPALLEELKDFFCYAQVKSQQQDTSGALDITGVFAACSSTLVLRPQQ